MWNTLVTSSFKPKTFVKATTEPDRLLQKTRLQHEKTLQGDEVKQFYEDIISSEPSSQQIKRIVPSRHITVRAPKFSDSSTDCLVISPARLFYASQINDVAFLRKCVGHGMNFDIRDEFGWTLLMTAACAGKVETVKFLLTKAVSVEACDKAGNTALSLAKKHHNFEIVNLIEQSQAQSKPLRETTSPSKGIIKDKYVHFFCDVCKVNVRAECEIRHKSSTVHVMHSSPKARTIYGISEANRGFQIMLNSGWNREKGLGSQGQGKKYPVKTVLKRDRQGIGAKNANVARVTHFQPNDPSSVSRSKVEAPNRRVERTSTMVKRKCEMLKKSEGVKEKLLRLEMEGL